MSDADRTTSNVLMLAAAILIAEAAGIVIVRIVGANPASTAMVAGLVLIAAFGVAGRLLRHGPQSSSATPGPARGRSPRTR